MRWRWMEEEEVLNLPEAPDPADGEDLLGIYAAVGGSVVRMPGYPGRSFLVPLGWKVKALGKSVGEGTYVVERVDVLSSSGVLSMRRGSLVAILPPDYREIADGSI